MNKVCCAPDLCKKALGTTAKCIDDTDKCDGSVSNDLCPGGVRCCAPATDYPPVGQLAAASGAVSGWACDKVCFVFYLLFLKFHFSILFFFSCRTRLIHRLMFIFTWTNQLAVAWVRRCVARVLIVSAKRRAASTRRNAAALATARSASNSIGRTLKAPRKLLANKSTFTLTPLTKVNLFVFEKCYDF